MNPEVAIGTNSKTTPTPTPPTNFRVRRAAMCDGGRSVGAGLAFLRFCVCVLCVVHCSMYGDITPGCFLPVFYVTALVFISHTTKPRPDGCHGPHASGLFSASRRSWWPILRQCTGRWPSVDTIYQEYAGSIFKTYAGSILKTPSIQATLGFVGFCVLASPGDLSWGF